MADAEELAGASPVDALENALVRVVNVRDKLRAVAVQVLGLDYLVPYKSVVRFAPSERALRHALSDLVVAGFSPAGRLKSLLEQLSEHPAIALRNEVVHAFTPRAARGAAVRTEIRAEVDR